MWALPFGRKKRNYMTRLFIAVLISVCCFSAANAQIVDVEQSEKFNTNSVLRDFDDCPFFGIYKDNYFVGGTSISNYVRK